MSEATLRWANEGGRMMEASGTFEALCWLARRATKSGGGAMLYSEGELRMVYINGTALYPDGKAVQ